MSCFRYFGSGNAAPAVLKVCSFGLVCAVADAHTHSAPRADRLHRNACGGCKSRQCIDRNLEHERSPKKLSRQMRRSWDYNHIQICVVKRFCKRCRKATVSIQKCSNPAAGSSNVLPSLTTSIMPAFAVTTPILEISGTSSSPTLFSSTVKSSS